MAGENSVKNRFHCFFCGEQLEDDLFGLLWCNSCKMMFLPFVDSTTGFLSMKSSFSSLDEPAPGEG